MNPTSSSTRENGSNQVRSGVKIFVAGAVALLVGALLQGFIGRKPEASPPQQEVEPAHVLIETTKPEPRGRTEPRVEPLAVDPSATLDQKGGIHVISARRNSKDATVEILYTITDIKKATDLSSVESSPHVLDLTTGDRVGVGSSVVLPKGINNHTRLRSAMMSNPQGQGFPPAPYRMVVGKTYQLLVPAAGGALRDGTTCVVVCSGLRSSPVVIEEIGVQP